jgi:multisubunit Na+/H+ antiporter MnhG subunit
MIQWLRRLLFESTPAEFRSAYGIEESVERLQAATKRSAFSAIGEAAAVGKVSPDGVRLQRVTPMVRNSFKPFFVGRFESRDGVTLLTGQFGMSLFTKIFMTFWLGMVALFGVGFLVASLSATASYPRQIVIGPFLMLIAGLGLVALGKWFARNDVAWLTGVIGRALEVPGVGAQTRDETKLDAVAVPTVLKGVALFLAASGVMALFAEFTAPKLGGVPILAPLGHWNIVYAIAVLSLSAGVWFRRLWAWWGGFLVLGLSIVSSQFFMRENAQVMPPPFMRVVFGIFSCVVVVVWGRWWYAQRKHFLDKI